MVSRREILAAGAAGAVMSASTARAASFGNPDEPPQGAINAKDPASSTDPGPQSQPLASQFPSAVSPPATDVGSLQIDCMGVFNTGPNVLTMDFNPGDIGYIKRNYGHYVQNVGETELQFFTVFRAPQYEEMSLSDWLRHSPPEMVAEHLNVDEATISSWPLNRPLILPA